MPPTPAPRLRSAVRDVVEVWELPLDQMLPPGHPARAAWAYVRKTEGEYAAQVRHRVERAFHRRAKELGYEVRKVELPDPADAPVG